MHHKGTKTLESGRLLLRQFEEQDAQAMYEDWASDPDVVQFLTWPVHESVEFSRSILREWEGQYAQMDCYNWAIVLKENGDTPIGGISVVYKDDNAQRAELGYCISKAWWNKGITSEAMRLVMAYLFDTVQFNRIEAKHDTENPGSGKVMLKCGLQYEGTNRSGGWNNRGICDLAVYGILAEEYAALKRA